MSWMRCMRWMPLAGLVLVSVACRGTAPLRVPAVAVSAQVPVGQPRCDGNFTGSGDVTAIYPAPPPQNIASVDTALSVVDTQDISVSLNPTSASFTATSLGAKSYAITGNLDDVCKDGKFKVRGTNTINSSPPERTVNSSGEVTVKAVGFKIAQGIDVGIIDNANFKIKVKLSCCPAAAGFVIEVVSQVNVASLSWAPAPPQLNCPGADTEFVATCVKQDEHREATVTLRVKRVADGKTCTLGTAIIEGH